MILALVLSALTIDEAVQRAFHVVGSRRLMLRDVRTTPEDFRLNTVVPAGTALDPTRAQAIANDMRAQLRYDDRRSKAYARRSGTPASPHGSVPRYDEPYGVASAAPCGPPATPHR
jgi:hypothetical protein